MEAILYGLGFPKIRVRFGSPYNKDDSSWKPIDRAPSFGKLPKCSDQSLFQNDPI